jgi:hypothetical protein
MLVLMVFTVIAPVVDPIDQVTALIRQDNIHAVSAFFAENVEVAVLDEENIYSKVQAELILDKFFTQNKPTSVKILHKVDSSPNYRYAALLINTHQGSYRAEFTLKGSGGNLALIQFRIQAGK